MMTVQFYNYLAAVEVQPQSVATPTHKFTRARYTLIGAAPLPGQAIDCPGQAIDCPGQILQIRDCPGDSGTVGAYAIAHPCTHSHYYAHAHKRIAQTRTYVRTYVHLASFQGRLKIRPLFSHVHDINGSRRAGMTRMREQCFASR